MLEKQTQKKARLNYAGPFFYPINFSIYDLICGLIFGLVVCQKDWKENFF